MGKYFIRLKGILSRFKLAFEFVKETVKNFGTSPSSFSNKWK